MSSSTGRNFLRFRHGIASDAFVVLACGSADQRKGVDIFVQVAARILLEQKERPNVHFIWIGDQSRFSADCTRWAHEDVKEMGLASRVHFVGAQRDLEPFFVGSDLFLLPSRQDPLPCVLHLAQAAGLPIVAFQNSGGAADVLAEGGGKLVEYGRISEMSTAVLQYFADVELRKTDGEIGKSSIHTRYNMDAYVDQLLSLAGFKTQTETNCRHLSTATPRSSAQCVSSLSEVQSS